MLLNVWMIYTCLRVKFYGSTLYNIGKSLEFENNPITICVFEGGPENQISENEKGFLETHLI